MSQVHSCKSPRKALRSSPLVTENANKLKCFYDKNICYFFYNCVVPIKETHLRLKACLASPFSIFVWVVVVVWDHAGVTKGVVNFATIAPTVGWCLGAVNKELLAEVEELSLLDGPVCLNGARSRESPARPTAVPWLFTGVQ